MLRSTASPAHRRSGRQQSRRVSSVDDLRFPFTPFVSNGKKERPGSWCCRFVSSCCRSDAEQKFLACPLQDSLWRAASSTVTTSTRQGEEASAAAAATVDAITAQRVLDAVDFQRRDLECIEETLQPTDPQQGRELRECLRQCDEMASNLKKHSQLRRAWSDYEAASEECERLQASLPGLERLARTAEATQRRKQQELDRLSTRKQELERQVRELRVEQEREQQQREQQQREQQQRHRENRRRALEEDNDLEEPLLVTSSASSSGPRHNNQRGRDAVRRQVRNNEHGRQRRREPSEERRRPHRHPNRRDDDDDDHDRRRARIEVVRNQTVPPLRHGVEGEEEDEPYQVDVRRRTRIEEVRSQTVPAVHHNVRDERGRDVDVAVRNNHLGHTRQTVTVEHHSDHHHHRGRRGRTGAEEIPSSYRSPANPDADGRIRELVDVEIPQIDRDMRLCQDELNECDKTVRDYESSRTRHRRLQHKVQHERPIRALNPADEGRFQEQFAASRERFLELHPRLGQFLFHHYRHHDNPGRRRNEDNAHPYHTGHLSDLDKLYRHLSQGSCPCGVDLDQHIVLFSPFGKKSMALERALRNMVPGNSSATSGNTRQSGSSTGTERPPPIAPNFVEENSSGDDKHDSVLPSPVAPPESAVRRAG